MPCVRTMDVSKIKGAYFLGIGGIGMSAIARYFVQQGISVFGYDKVRTSLCEKLEQEGMTIHYEDDSKKIPAEFIESPQTHICVYTPAIPTDFGEYSFLLSKNIPLFKRADVLGFITKDSFTIAVAGTHGKTTTSTLLARALSAYDINFTAFLGGISTDFDTNFVSISNKKELFEKPIIVVEADEFDRSFLKLSPNIAIVTSTDADHLDIYGKESGVREGFEDFVKCIKEGGVLVQKKGLNLPCSDKIKSVTYGHKYSKANYTYNNPNFTYNRFIFAWQGPSEGLKVMLGIPGEHNAENATAVLAVLDKLKLEVAKSSKKISNSLIDWDSLN